MKIIHSHSISPAFNLAAEEYLFSELQDDILFLYVNEPSVIIGSNQVLRNEVNIDFCNAHNIQILRRISGGGAVYHDLGNINYSFINNKHNNQSSLRADFLLPVVEVLKAMNIPVEIGKRKDLWLPGGFKVSGTASHVSRNRELHHGTLLYDADVEKLQNALTVKAKDETLKGTVSVSAKVKNMRAFLIELNGVSTSNNEFFDLLIYSFGKYYNSAIFGLNNIEISEIESIQKYNQNEWTFRK
ncbi:MAG: lipoate--protein ligase family protein [Paludibacter sp.]|nr:lipoate--protein ligase family protein [Paludibacter sp.]